jgi:hypothetical protein
MKCLLPRTVYDDLGRAFLLHPRGDEGGSLGIYNTSPPTAGAGDRFPSGRLAGCPVTGAEVQDALIACATRAYRVATLFLISTD